MLLRERNRASMVGGTLIALIGLGFFFDSFGVWNMQFVYIWPVAFIAVGLSVLLGHAQRLEVEEERSSQLLAAEERVRIARELHDIVAHSVSLMTLQITAALRVFDARPEEAKKVLEAAGETGRSSLNELRTILSILRSADASIEAASLGTVRPEAEGAPTAPLPGLGDLDGLVKRTREAGLDVTLAVRGERPEAGPGVELAAYRVVQEALTNALRHAGGARVNVSVEYGRDSIEVKVDDDGAGATPTTGRIREGQGLTGMRERVKAIGGTLAFGPKPTGGWLVSARIPLGRAS